MRYGTTDLDAMLADPQIDAVIVCSPTDLHADHTARALRAGKHVLCEIPLATSLAETDELIALADEINRRLMVCQTQRYFAPVAEAKRIIASGELHVHAIVSRYLFDRRNNVNWKGRNRSWTDNLLWHHMCHALDATMWLLGADDVERGRPDRLARSGDGHSDGDRDRAADAGESDRNHRGVISRTSAATRLPDHRRGDARSTSSIRSCVRRTASSFRKLETTRCSTPCRFRMPSFSRRSGRSASRRSPRVGSSRDGRPATGAGPARCSGHVTTI